jgi:hypothetical protein
VTAVVTPMSIYCRKKCNFQSANPKNEKPSCHKVESAKFLEENTRKTRDLTQNKRKGQILKKLAPKSKNLEPNCTNSKLKHAKSRLNRIKKLDPIVSNELKVKIRQLGFCLTLG